MIMTNIEERVKYLSELILENRTYIQSNTGNWSEDVRKSHFEPDFSESDLFGGIPEIMELIGLAKRIIKISPKTMLPPWMLFPAFKESHSIWTNPAYIGNIYYTMWVNSLKRISHRRREKYIKKYPLPEHMRTWRNYQLYNNWDEHEQPVFEQRNTCYF